MAAGIIRRTLIATLLAVAIGSVWAQAAPAQVPAPPGGPVLVVTDPGRSVRAVLRRDPARRGPERVRDRERRDAQCADPRGLSGRRARRDRPHRRPGRRPHRLGQRRRQPDRDAPRREPGRAARAGLRRRRSRQRLPAGRPPGRGITGETMQFHGTADLWTGGGGATPVATLFSNASTSTASPAVTLRTVGAGQAAAFTYDLARSVVYTRQGNPAWAGQERDGLAPIRSDDMFFGAGQRRRLGRHEQGRDPAGRRAAAPARRPDHADERGPHAAAALLVPAARREGGGDHDRRRSRQRRDDGQFDSFKAESPAGCSVANWECIRSTSYVFPWTTIPNATALPGGRLRDRPAPEHGLQRLHADVAPQRLDASSCSSSGRSSRR